ncbi:hypothetical protein PtA15_5A210 [Puccinia triticina]|uniref:Uncharacterized protein n=1 Tax=Puccinia triticina TaxID=208348 RepID=A0ABY7CJH1_9BASI|nr:uncharacterized protein PtA15_5A210 [Puccinia triticina]WAQ84637.1 hypothetical protein PtA15_5A210 [Puccinia triticina]
MYEYIFHSMTSSFRSSREYALLPMAGTNRSSRGRYDDRFVPVILMSTPSRPPVRSGHLEEYTLLSMTGSFRSSGGVHTPLMTGTNWSSSGRCTPQDDRNKPVIERSGSSGHLEE